MSSKPNRRKCRCCKIFFLPDVHNPGRQFFCLAPDCRLASKAASQRRWLRKPGNRNYFRDAENMERVRQWRKAHPGYWKGPKSISKPSQPTDSEALNLGTISCNVPVREIVALQDFALTEHPAFVGLISMVTGSTLQDHIAEVGRNLLLQGKNILGLYPREKTPPYDTKTTDPTRSCPPSASQLQLGGPSPGS